MNADDTYLGVDISEIRKMEKVSEDSNKLGEFLEWMLNSKHFVLAQWVERERPARFEPKEELCTVPVSIERLLADYFKIDLDLVDKQRKALLQVVANYQNSDTR